MSFRAVVTVFAATAVLVGPALATAAHAERISERAAAVLGRPTDASAKGYHVLYGFSGVYPFGKYLVGGVLVDKFGNIFGTTAESGTPRHPPFSTPGAGTLFELQPLGNSYVETNIAVFTGSNGQKPYDRPIEDASGNLFLTTSGGGGGSDPGTVNEFSLGANGWFQSAIAHLGSSLDPGTQSGCASSDFPIVEPTEREGTLYIPTVRGGLDEGNYGTVCALNASSFRGTVIYTFKGPGTGDLAYPSGPIAAGPGGMLYGSTEGGGAGNGSLGGGGGVYALGNGYSVAFRFPQQPSGRFIAGAWPNGSLVVDERGSIYGTTFAGGSYAGICGARPAVLGCGVVYKLTKAPSGVYKETVLHVFTAGVDGDEPTAGLTRRGTTLYGTTSVGGCLSGSTLGCGDGTLFAISTSGAGYRILHRFQGGPRTPPSDGTLTFAHGSLYGTAGGDSHDGAAGGVVYRYTL